MGHARDFFRWTSGPTGAVAVTVAASLLAGPLQAQKLPTLKAAPLYGTQSLVGGFEPDPVEVDLEAGGDGDASLIDASCAGSINFAAPDLSLDYRATIEALTIYVTSETDTTLVVRSPSGAWLCNDDAFGQNPGVTFDEPRSGLYLIWVGTFDGGFADATLGISELGLPTDETEIDPFTAEPLYGQLTLATGFTPDPRTVEVVAGGPDDLSQFVPLLLEEDRELRVDGSCVGFVNLPQPDVRLNFRSEGGPLYIFAKAAADTTLFVISPDATIACSDDGDDPKAGQDPIVVFRSAPSGDYNIWIGTFEADDQNPDAELFVSEVGFE